MQTLEESCSATVTPDRCRVVEDRTSARVAVEWHSANEVHIDIKGADLQPRSTRRLVFRSSDAARDRWRSVGLVVGTLAGTVVPQDTATDARAAHFPRVWAGIGTILGTGLEGGTVRYGADVWVGFRPASSPVFARVGVQYAVARERSLDIRGAWTSFQLGLGVLLAPWPWLQIRPHVGLGLENVEAEVLGSAEPTSAGSRRRGVALGGLGLAIRLLPSTSLVLAGAGTLRHGATGIAVGAERVTAFPAYTGSAVLGLELRYPLASTP